MITAIEVGHNLRWKDNVEYTAYSGRQQTWPVASGSFVQRKFDVPLY
jgi:hypothetical protein